MVLLWVRTACASMLPRATITPRVNRTEPMKVLQISLKFSNYMYVFLNWSDSSENQKLDPDWQSRSWGWRRVISYRAMQQLLIILRDLGYGCLDRCHIPIGRWDQLRVLPELTLHLIYICFITWMFFLIKKRLSNNTSQYLNHNRT